MRQGRPATGSAGGYGGAGALSFSGFWDSAKSLANSVKTEVETSSREIRGGVSEAYSNNSLTAYSHHYRNMLGVEPASFVLSYAGVAKLYQFT